MIATGGSAFSGSCPASSTRSPPAGAATAAERIRDRLRDMQRGTIAVGFAGNPNEATAVGAARCSGFWYEGIDEQLRREGRREHFEIVFFNPSAEPGNRLGAKAVRHLLDEMARRGIRTHLGHQAQALRGRQGGHREQRIRRRPDPVHARHDRQRTWFDSTSLPLAGRPAA
ncbi:MAG: hypothetical protein R3E68_16920 [Burkholderiaceae bacterium]